MGNLASTLDGILFFGLYSGYRVWRRHFPSKRAFHWSFVPTKPDLGTAVIQWKPAHVPAPRDSQPASATSQTSIIYTVT